MAQENQAQNPIEQCLVTLTQLMAQNMQPRNQRQRIEKEIRYLPIFKGEPGTLPSFIDSVTAALEEYGGEADRVFQIIYNEKIQGGAKNLLKVEPPANWEQCVSTLKRHYRSSKNQMTITREISSLRVSNIQDLDNKLTKLVEDITEFVAFDDNGRVMLEIFGGMLVQRIKELVSGSLAYAIMNKVHLREIREIINKFVGQDQGNLNLNLVLKNFNKSENNKNLERKINGQHNKFERKPNNNFNNNFGQYRNNNLQPRHNYNNNYNNNNINNNNNRTQQTRQINNRQNESRQSRQRPEPMEVDTVSRPETNTIDETFFIN